MGQEAAAGHRRADIQGLRAIAVLLVLAYHAGLPLPGGFRGVDVFFVISGFVITAMLLRQLSAGGTIPLRRFYLQRARRLTPALAAVVLAVAAASVFLESPLGEQQVTSRTGIAALLLSANYAIHGTVGGYFDAAAEQNPLLHTWSLSVEEQFYLVFPFLVLAAWRIGRGRRSLLALMLGVAGAASLGLAVATALKGADSLLFFGSPTRAWEFAAGALLALGRRSHSERIRGGGTGAAAGAVLLLVAAMLPEGTGSYQLATGLLTVVATVLVLAAGVAGNAFSRALGRKMPVWIGDRSYSLYLWHWPLVVLAEKALPGMPGVALAATALSFPAAAASYRWIEQPFRLVRRRAGLRTASAPLAYGGAALGLCLVLGLGAGQRWGNDFLQEYASKARQVADTSIDGCTSQPGIWTCERRVAGSTGRAYLIGDSHALSLSPAVLEAGANLGLEVSVRTRTGCSFAKFDPSGPRQARVCDRWVDEVLEEITAAGPDIVIVHQCARIGIECSGTGGDWLEQWSEAVGEAVSSLRSGGAEVLVVRDVPSFPNDLAGCAPAWRVQGCGVQPLEEAMSRLAPVREAEDRASPGVLYVDPVPGVCGTVVCAQMVGGEAIYADAHHLTVVGALKLVKPLEAAIRGAITLGRD